MQSVYQIIWNKKTGTAWTLRVMMTFQRWKPTCMKWLRWWNFTENGRRDRLGWFGLCRHTAMKLRVFSDILWSSCLEDYDIKTETCISYIFVSFCSLKQAPKILCERKIKGRVCQARVCHSQILDWKLFTLMIFQTKITLGGLWKTQSTSVQVSLSEPVNQSSLSAERSMDDCRNSEILHIFNFNFINCLFIPFDEG